MVALRTGGQLRPQLLVEDAAAVDLPEAHAGLLAAMRRRWVIGTAGAAAERVRELAAAYDVDEVMVHPVAGALAGTPADAAPARQRTLELLAEGLRPINGQARFSRRLVRRPNVGLFRGALRLPGEITES